MIENIILLCSDITKGMKSYGPKAFIPIGRPKQPLIIHQLQKLKKIYSKKVNIFIVIGFEKEKFIKTLDQYKQLQDNVHIVWHKEYNTTNSAYAMLLALKKINNGNTLVIQNGIISEYRPKDSNISAVPILNTKQQIKNKTYTFNIGVTTQSNLPKYLFYDLDNKWSELLYIADRDLDSVKSLGETHTIKHRFLFEFINLMIENKIMLTTEKISPTQIRKIHNHKNK